MLGVLVFIHEFGHFIVAKWFGVRVEVFSIGFVGSIVSFRWGETEYRIGWLPLGGYVRMFGDGDTSRIPEELKKRAFAFKPLWQRTLIILAGPLANLFVLPILALVVVHGAQKNELSTVIGTIMPRRPAERAGLRPGDRILSVNGVSTRYFRDLLDTIGSAPNSKLRLQIQRGQKTFTVHLKPQMHTQYDFLGTPQKRGLIGIIAAYRSTEIGLSNPSSPLYRAGLRTWDKIVAVDGVAVKRWGELLRALNRKPEVAKRIRFQRRVLFQNEWFEHDQWIAPQEVSVRARRKQNGQYDWGIHSAELFVRSIRPGTPLAKIGIQPGDRILSLAGRRLLVYSDFMSVPRQKTKKYPIIFERNGHIVKKTFKLEPVVWMDSFNQRHTRIMLGATLTAPYERGDVLSIRHRFRYALKRAIQDTWRLNGLIFRAIGQLFSGKVKTDTIGGPIMLYQIAKKAVKSGWEVFLRHMTLISINLGLINLLPIPVLDGGHLMFFLFEGVTRKPVPPRIRHWFLLVGFVFLLMMMFLAFRNDITRFFLM